MKRTFRSGAGDFLRAIETLEATDEEARDRIGALLGLERKAPPPTRRRATDADVGTNVPLPSSVLPRRHEPASPRAPQRRSAGRALPATLSPTTSPVPAQPEWMAQTFGLQDTMPSDASAAPAAPLLFPPLKARGILTVLAGSPVEYAELDLGRMIEELALRRPVTRFPRISGLTLSRGTQLLIDRGPATMPFWADFAALQRNLTSLLGSAALQVVEFAGAPLETAASPLHGDGDEENYRTHHTPPAGTQVIALTDLGIGWPGPAAARSTAEDWLAFSSWLKRCSCPFTALVPYGRSRWPKAMLGAFPIIHWAPSTTARQVSKMLGKSGAAGA